MEIKCEKCGKHYRIDETRIKGPVARLRCRQCQNILEVRNPLAATPTPPPEPSPAPEPDPAAAPAPGPSVEPAPRRPVVAAEPVKVRFGLTAKISLLMLAISLIPFGLLWFVTFQETGNRIRANSELIMAETAEGLGRQVDEWLDKNVRILEAAAGFPQIKGMDPAAQEPILKAINAAYPWMYLVFTLDAQGMNLARNDGQALRDYSDRDYYKGVLGGKDLAWQTLIGKTSKKPALVLAVPIKRGGQIIGVMAAAMTTDDISKSVARWRQGETGFAFLVDETGKVVAHQIRDFVVKERNLKNHPLVAAYQSEKRAQIRSFADEQGNPVQGYVRGNRYGWALALQQAQREVFSDLARVKQFALALLAATVVVVLLVAWLAARALVKPIAQLTDMAEKMSMGDLEVEVNIHSRDEIGQLAAAVGRMQTSLRMAIERLRRR